MKTIRFLIVGLCVSIAIALPARAQYLWGRESGKPAFSPGRFPCVAVDGDYIFVSGVNTDAPTLVKRGNPVIEKLDRFGRPMWSTNGSGIRCNLKGNPVAAIGPNFLECLPDGQGGVVVFWAPVEGAEYRLLSAQRFSAEGERLWGDYGKTNLAYWGGSIPDENVMLLLPSGTNGIVAVWQVSAHVCIPVATLFDWDGNTVWSNLPFGTARGENIMDVCADEIGGTLYVKPLDDGDEGRSCTTMVQRLDEDGTILWGDGIPLAGLYDLYEIQKTWPRIAADGSGGAVVIYNDKDHRGNVHAQRLDAGGNMLWDTNGIIVCSNATSVTVMATCLVRVEPDTWVAVWSDNRTGYYNVYAQKVSGTGVVAWTENGLPVCTVPENHAWQDQSFEWSNKQQLQAIPDGEGGVWIAWLSSYGNQGYYLQHLDENGNTLLPGTARGFADGIPVSYGVSVQDGFSLAAWRPNAVMAAWDTGDPEVRVGTFYSGAPAITSSLTSAATVGTTLTLTNMDGVLFQPGVQVYLQRPGESIIGAMDVSVDASDNLICTFNFGEDWTARDSSRAWRGIACSDDGANWIASAGGSDYLHLSTNGGATWAAAASSLDWRGVAASSDGRALAGVAYGGPIYISRDASATWDARDSSHNWMAIASSADARHLIAAGFNDTLYLSSDYGAAWTPVESNRPWYGVACSDDGSRWIAAAGGPASSNRLVVSGDYGATWTIRDDERQWRAVASSADGSTLAAVVYGGKIYTSDDYGVTWTARDSDRYWTGIACSDDGKRMVACAGGSAYSDQIYVSGDGGVTWTAEGPAENWVPIACSSDGRRIVAGDYNGQLYTRVLEPETGLWLLTVENSDGQTTSMAFDLRPETYPPDTLGKSIDPGLQLLGCPFGSDIALSEITLTNGTRGATFFEGDNIMIYNSASGTFSNYWLDSSGAWVDNSGPATNVMIDPGGGFWYRSRGGSSFNWNETRPW
ncbi:MAG TPA: hypothetical protein PKM67_09330 [Kiritimatiellia bacterium]|nr:hypothetical protein [Kiritimatiellia bacterium]HPA78810.1 hypothetical protein [Kiritimatiellia bacterium]HQQ04043.1 hypothetical protein [Kiritimatiellia bacterium]